MGDYYYKPVPIEEAIKVTYQYIPKSKEIKTEEDINRFTQEIINEKIPYTQPQWIMYI